MSPVFPSTGCIPAPEALAARTRAWAAPLERAIAPDLRALYIYGSALAPDFDPATSDVNVLLVAETLSMDRLAACAAALNEPSKNSELRFAPLLLTQPQIASSVDVFPIEFMDLTQRRALLQGTDVLGAVQVGRANLRHQCEYELRAQLVGLRRAVLRSGAAPATAWALLAQVAGSTAALCRSLLHLQGEAPPEAGAGAIEAAARVFGVRADALAAPLEARRRGAAAAQNAAATHRLGEYIEELERLIAAVDAHPVV